MERHLNAARQIFAAQLLRSSSWELIVLGRRKCDKACDCNRHIQESPIQEPRNPQKVSKRTSRASRPGVSKKCRKSPKMTRKRVKNTTKISARGLFLTLRARSLLGKSFLRLFGDFGAPVYGDCHRKTKHFSVKKKVFSEKGGGTQ